MTASPTDDDIRRKLRISAIRAAEILGILVEPVLDPRAFEDGEVPDGSAMNRMLQASSKAIDAWARTCEEPKLAPAELPAASDPDRRAALRQLLRDNPAALQEIAAEAGVEIRRVR